MGEQQCRDTSLLLTILPCICTPLAVQQHTRKGQLGYQATKSGVRHCSHAASNSQVLGGFLLRAEETTII
jgi:hypothetical protein